jgi:hypothetical protein
MLTAHLIKAVCEVLQKESAWREAGPALFEAFDSIDLAKVEKTSSVQAAEKRISRAAAMAERIRAELGTAPRRRPSNRSKGSPALEVGA